MVHEQDMIHMASVQLIICLLQINSMLFYFHCVSILGSVIFHSPKCFGECSFSHTLVFQKQRSDIENIVYPVVSCCCDTCILVMCFYYYYDYYYYDYLLIYVLFFIQICLIIMWCK